MAGRVTETGKRRSPERLGGRPRRGLVGMSLLIIEPVLDHVAWPIARIILKKVTIIFRSVPALLYKGIRHPATSLNKGHFCHLWSKKEGKMQKLMAVRPDKPGTFPRMARARPFPPGFGSSGIPTCRPHACHVRATHAPHTRHIRHVQATYAPHARAATVRAMRRPHAMPCLA